MTSPAISLRGIHKRYGEHHVLKGIDLLARDGDVISLIGASGSGKSTLLRCIPFLETPQHGEVAVSDDLVSMADSDGRLSRAQRKVVNRIRAQIGFVFQNFNLWPHLTVLQNVIEAPVHVQRRDRKDCVAEAEHLLDRVGLASKRNAWPAQLSGGQQQRVAIARALALRPKALLFDEPTSALDPELVGEVLRVMRSLADEGRTMIIVTHEMAFAREVSNKVVFLYQGLVEEQGPPEQVFKAPLSDRCRAFVGGHLHRSA